ncbi:hypothetical protein GCM10011515_20550 [Tsuneonella deserti]|uniref:Phage shock protein B n=1 Tax=Tsuneonella deserti TaxID=2035528 RepID=A0ABQ1SB62_9SPHN|nr:hypothetical protein [Tsuneonella deserti]GGE00655.1 hypothetical protein GCM10011515_20550 [Tsuneonella deserti]
MDQQIVLAATSLTAIAIVAFATLRGWQGWLALKEHELERGVNHLRERHSGPETGSALGAARIEISDLKERIRKLEAIASGVDL